MNSNYSGNENKFANCFAFPEIPYMCSVIALFFYACFINDSLGN